FKSSLDANEIPMEGDWVLAENIKFRQIEFHFTDLHNQINDHPHSHSYYFYKSVKGILTNIKSHVNGMNHHPLHD
ncbi:hypothetical protein ACFTRA_18730, partial [Bacillus spizizenii]|uniref:hypothetical protein n=1 Tax=Bacillus spizizenii TaxID=96241 RepID=UPI003633222E